MRLNKVPALPEDKDRVIAQIRRCRSWGQLLNGLPYNDDLAGCDGIHLEVIAPHNTAQGTLEFAIREGRAKRDVMSHSVLLCPTDWFEATQ